MANYTRDELIKKLHIESLSYDDQQAMLQNVANVVSSRIINGIGDKLQEPDLQELDHLVDKGDEKEIETFIRSKFEDYDKFAAETQQAVVEDIAKDIELSRSLVTPQEDYTAESDSPDGAEQSAS